MKKMLMVLVLANGLAMAQQPADRQDSATQAPATQAAEGQPAPQVAKPPKFTSNRVEKPQSPTFSDINCAGFVTREAIPAANFVVGGQASPQASRFSAHDMVFLTGPGYAESGQYRIVRRVENRNRTKIFPDEAKLIKDAGDQWADIGYLHVTNLDPESGYAVAQVDFSCQPVSVGDILVPYVERPTPRYTRTIKQFKVFGVPTSSVVGRIIGSRDFDYLLGTGRKIYVNIGGDKGVKPGDYLRITRGYDPDKDLTPIDNLSDKAYTRDEDSERMPTVNRHDYHKFPRRGIGEVLVLSVTANTATGVVSLSREDIHLGDQVEVEASNK